MTSRTAALRRAVEHPVTRLVAVALLQAVATHLGKAAGEGGSRACAACRQRAGGAR
ncbi:hypothetical protein ABZ840_18735 [Streptomyces sp. NPDC047117]|uniref:hypothetical protein n=1 Tax=unclassified Streptomyces TaxID=2593676 RepID=UPI0033CB25F8